MRQWAHDRQAIRSRLSQLSVRNCICAVEADRAVAYSNVAMLMKAVENLPRSATEDDALDSMVGVVLLDFLTEQLTWTR